MSSDTWDEIIVYIVDDDPGITAYINVCIKLFWPESHIREFDSASGLFSAISNAHPNLILLDLNLRDGDATSAIENIRKLTSASLVVVSASGFSNEQSIVSCLLQGADDYVCKPFTPEILIARIKSVLRRSRMDRDAKESEVIVRGLKIDIERGIANRSGNDISLSKTDIKLLRLLINAEGNPVPGGRMRSEVWGLTPVSESALKMSIHRLRKKLGDTNSARPLIRNCGFMGYQLVTK